MAKPKPAQTASALPRIGSEPEPSTWIPQDNRLFDRSSIIVMLIGAILFVIGLGIDLATPKYPEIAAVFEACTPPSGTSCEFAVRTFDRQSHFSSDLSVAGLIAETLKALGLTIVAAVFISSTVDRRTRRYFFGELARKTEILGSNVLLGMFEARHHPRLFSLVKEHVFDRKLVRKNIDINYTLSDLDVDLSATRLAGEHYLTVDVILSTVSENINASQTVEKGAIEVPVRLALPNPLLAELKCYVRINSFRIGNTSLSPERIAAINADLQARLADDEMVDAPVDIGSVTLGPGEQVTVSGSYTMVKELQDTEVFRSAEIAENIHLTVVSKSRHALAIRARSLAHGKLYDQFSPTAQQWKLDDLSLPMQGIMVWWKRAPKALITLQTVIPEPTIVDDIPQRNEPTGAERVEQG